MIDKKIIVGKCILRVGTKSNDKLEEIVDKVNSNQYVIQFNNLMSNHYELMLSINHKLLYRAFTTYQDVINALDIINFVTGNNITKKED